MKQRAALTLVLALALAGCGARQDYDLQAAIARWQARPLGHYQLDTTDVLGSRTCNQSVEVRDEQLVRVIDNTCQYPNLWAVSWLFHHTSRALAPPNTCALLDPVAGCICRTTAEVAVEYDPAYGYPRVIVVRPTWQAAWQGSGYWWYTLQHGALPNCTPPSVVPSEQVIVRQVISLP